MLLLQYVVMTIAIPVTGRDKLFFSTGNSTALLKKSAGYKGNTKKCICQRGTKRGFHRSHVLRKTEKKNHFIKDKRMHNLFLSGKWLYALGLEAGLNTRYYEYGQS